MIHLRGAAPFMKLQILMFGPVAEAVGARSLALEVPDAVSVERTLEILQARYPELSVFRTSIAVAVNQEYVSAEALLSDGDELALIPPVSGG